MEERKTVEVTFYLRPHLLEFVTGICGKGSVELDPFNIIGITASACLRRTKQPYNGAFRAGRLPITFRMVRYQRVKYGAHVGNHQLVAFERAVQLLLHREVLTYVQARRASAPALPLKEAILEFLEARHMSLDHLAMDTLYQAVEPEEKRAARKQYHSRYYADTTRPNA